MVTSTGDLLYQLLSVCLCDLRSISVTELCCSRRYYLDRPSGNDRVQLLVQHSCSVEVLAWGETILAAGPDLKVPRHSPLSSSLFQKFLQHFEGHDL